MKINGNPDGGGGGGVINSLNVTSNGTYTAGGGVDGYSPVTVSVPIPEFVTETLNASVNGTYTPGQGVDGYSQVVVSVPQDVEGYTLEQVVEGNLGSIPFLMSPISEMKTVGCWDTVEAVSMPNLKSVPDRAFRYNNVLSSVSLPQCKTIGEYAFAEDPNLQNVYIPECESIVYGFNGCRSLISISLPNVKILQGAFQNCESLQTVYMPNVEYIDGQVFFNCGNLTGNVDIPKCSRLGYGEFWGCHSLTSASIPMCIQMGPYMFFECRSLSQLTLCTETYYIPEYNETLTDTAFSSGIGSIYVDAAQYDKFVSAEGWSMFASLLVSVGDPTQPMFSMTSDGVIYGKTKVVLNNVFNLYGYDKNSATVLSMSKCEEFNDFQMNGCSSLTTVNLPYIKSTTYGMFAWCQSLTSVSIPNVEYIHEQTFFGCTQLSQLDLPECIQISRNAFDNCYSLISISLPKCEILVEYAMYGCTSMTELSLPVCSFIGHNGIPSTLNTLTLGYSGVCECTFAELQFISSLYVPASLVEDYKVTYPWNTVSNAILPISE